MILLATLYFVSGFLAGALTVIPGNIYECEWFDYVRHGCAGRTTVR